MGVPDRDLDPGLSRSAPSPYVYPSALKRFSARLLDAAGDFWLAPAPRPIDWKGSQRIAVLRLDHLGDLLHAFPALKALRQSLPKAHIDLLVGPWGKEIAELCPFVDRVLVCDAPWFQRPQRVAWPWAAIQALAETLRRGDYDLGLELRGDLRHHLALWLAGVPHRAGQAVTAGRFLLTHPARYRPGLHEVEQNLSLLEQSGLDLKKSAKDVSGLLKIPAFAVNESAKVSRALNLRSGFVAIQAACGTPAKRWMPEHWAALIAGLPKGLPLVLLGSESEREEMLAIAGRLGSGTPVKVAAGLLTLSGLAAFLKKAKLLISVDSGPAHLAATLGTPVLALYSATNRPEQWGLRGAHTRMLRSDVPCSPCELSVCPYDNECMRRITVASALKAAGAML